MARGVQARAEGVGMSPIMRVCIERGCGRIVPATDYRCEAHKRGHNKRGGRPTTTERGYGAAHQRRARAAIAAHPWCSDCGATEDLTADHVTPMSTVQRHFCAGALSAGEGTRVFVPGACPA